MNIALLLLCHEHPDIIAQRLRCPFFRDPAVWTYIHYDARQPAHLFDELRVKIASCKNVTLLSHRVVCRWGEYSLVEATHRLLQAALSDSEFNADYCALISGSCIPIRPFASLQEFLRRRQGLDFIQTHDISQSRWIKDGLEMERCHYYFPFNFITHRQWFERATALQRRLKVKRQIPDGLRIHFGSQWFCLSRSTGEKVVAALNNPQLQAFFGHSWIPDEFAIQTIVAGCQAAAFRAGHCLTYYEFDEQGCPLVLDNGHLAHLLDQPFFFARKLAQEARELTNQLSDYVAGREYDLSYFDNVGRVSPAYKKHLAEAAESRSRKAQVGTAIDPWRGVMDVSVRPYFVLYSASAQYLIQLMAAARTHVDAPLFDFPFHPGSLLLADTRKTYLGFQASDRYRRDYDPAAFLYELTHVHPTSSVAFGLDPAISGWVRDFVQWDGNAILVNCDPLGLSLEQKAAAIIRSATITGDVEATNYASGSIRSKLPLRHDHFHRVWEGKEYACSFIALHRESEGDPLDATLRALRTAAWQVDSSKWFPSPQAARALLVK